MVLCWCTEALVVNANTTVLLIRSIFAIAFAITNPNLGSARTVATLEFVRLTRTRTIDWQIGWAATPLVRAIRTVWHAIADLFL